MYSKFWEKENPHDNQVLGISRAQKLQQCWKLIETMQSAILEVDLVCLIVCVLSTPSKVTETTWSAWSMCINLYNSRAQKSIWYAPNHFILRKYWCKNIKYLICQNMRHLFSWLKTTTYRAWLSSRSKTSPWSLSSW